MSASIVKHNILLILVLVFAPAVCWAQVFTNDVYGYSIEVDDSFELTRNDRATYFKSKDKNSVIIIKNWPGLDEAAAKDYLLDGYQDEHIAIVSVSEPKEVEVSDGKCLLVDAQAII